MQYDVLTTEGVVADAHELPEDIFQVEINEDLVHQVLRAIEEGHKRPVAHAKDRSERRGGGKKPWRQKGTGRARHGSSRSPIWRKGGVTFGPSKEGNFHIQVNKKMKRKALYMALSDRVKDRNLYLLQDISVQEKTKEALRILQNCEIINKHVLLVLPEKNDQVEKSFRNISSVEIITANSLNVEEVLKSDVILAPVSSIQVIVDTYKV